MIVNCRSHIISNPFNVSSSTFFHQPRPIILASNPFVFWSPLTQTLRSDHSSPSIIDITVDVSSRISIMTARINFIVTVQIRSIVSSYSNIVYIVHRIVPADVIVIICNIIDWSVVEVEIGVIIPWTPFIAADISIDNAHLR